MIYYEKEEVNRDVGDIEGDYDENGINVLSSNIVLIVSECSNPDPGINILSSDIVLMLSGAPAYPDTQGYKGDKAKRIFPSHNLLVLQLRFIIFCFHPSTSRTTTTLFMLSTAYVKNHENKI